MSRLPSHTVAQPRSELTNHIAIRWYIGIYRCYIVGSDMLTHVLLFRVPSDRAALLPRRALLIVSNYACSMPVHAVLPTLKE